MAISRTNWIDDDGSGTTGTVINNAEKTLLYDQIDAALVGTTSDVTSSVVTLTTSGTITALPLQAGKGSLAIIMNNASTATIHGVALGAVNGQRLTIYALNARVDFVHFSGTSTAAAFWNIATSAPTSIMSIGGNAQFQYMDGVWRMVAHEQGAWITPPFNAANFAASGSSTYTVAAGGVSAYQYRLSGRTLTVRVFVSGTLAVAPAILYVYIPGGFTYAGAEGTDAITTSRAFDTAYSIGTVGITIGTILQCWQSVATAFTVGAGRIVSFEKTIPVN